MPGGVTRGGLEAGPRGWARGGGNPGGATEGGRTERNRRARLDVRRRCHPGGR